MLMYMESFGDCRWLKASMKTYPVSSRLSPDHTAQTDAAFSFVMLTVAAAVAFLPHVPLSPLLSSPVAFICLGTGRRWRFSLTEPRIETSVMVAYIYGEVLILLILVLVLDSRPCW